MRYPSVAAGKHPTTIAVGSSDRDTDGGPHRAWFRARYCFHDSL